MEGPGFVIGNVAKGRDFWNRTHETQAIWKTLQKGSLLLKAPRRFGKTSIMYHIYENPAPGFKAFYLDVEGMGSPLDFISTLIMAPMSDSAIKEKAGSMWKKIKGLAGKIEELEVADFRLKIREHVGADWKEKGTDLIKRLAEYDGDILLVIDELPVLVQNIMHKSGKEAACDFLQWFRAIRQTPELARVRWLAGGSIGIEHVLDTVGAGTKVINDFEILMINPFTTTEAERYIRELLKHEGEMQRVPSSVVQEFLRLIGAPVPYFIQILVKESLYEMERQGRKSLNRDIIERAYFDGVLGPASRTYFEHYFTRLRDYYDEKTEHVAKRLILEVARLGSTGKKELFRLFKMTGRGAHRDETFSYLMTDLENDFYLTYSRTTETYCFSTNILRDWWLRYHDMVEE